ncbi:MAG: RNA polymerase sigma factor [Dysosmobacter welbionis]
MKYKKIWKYQPYRTSRREQDYQQVQEFLKSGDPELWKALYESAYEIVYQCAYGMDFCRVLGPDDYCEIADEAFALCYEQLDRYQGLSQFSGWVGGYSKNITRTRCRQVLTGLRYRRRLMKSPPDGCGIGIPVDPDSSRAVLLSLESHLRHL